MKKEKPRSKIKYNFKFNIYYIYLLIFLVFLFLQFYSFTPKPQEINLNTLRNLIKENVVSKLVIVNKEYVEIYIKPELLDSKFKNLKEKGYKKSKPHFYYVIISPEFFSQEMNKILEEIPNNEIKIINESRKDYLSDILSWLIPIAILFLLWILVMKKMAAGGSQLFNVGKARARLFDKETKIKVNFNDVAGLEEAKLELQEIVDFLRNPDKYTKLGGKIPKGALLIGPPGTGKTLLAKAVAGEADVPFLSISGSEFVELFVGVGASRVRDLFQQAKEKAPCIVFIDEIDAVGRARGKAPSFGANDERENTLNQLLTEMDGFDSSSRVIIIAATNRPDILDKALVRSGRFDRQIHIELPDVREREEIFKVHLRNVKYDKNIDLSFLAKQTPGFSGADIANVCNEAALIAARKNKNQVEKEDFLDAIDRIVAGLERKNKVITEKEKRIIAFHEAGHATVSWFLKYANPLLKVTIIPRGKTLGAAWFLPEERQISSKQQILDEICVGLAGRASELIFFKKISTGAFNDLEKVTKQAYALVAYFGMSEKLANISYYDSSNQYELYLGKPFSEKTAEIIDREVKKIVDKQFLRAKKILLKHKEGVKKLAHLLLEKEVIYSEDIEQIFGKRPFISYHEELEKEKIKFNIKKNNEENLQKSNNNDNLNEQEMNSKNSS